MRVCDDRSIHETEPRALVHRTRKVVRTHHHRTAFSSQLVKERKQEFLGGHVEAREWLVKQQQSWLQRESPRHQHALTLTTRELTNWAFSEVRHMYTMKRIRHRFKVTHSGATQPANVAHESGHHCLLDRNRKVPRELMPLRHISNSRSSPKPSLTIDHNAT
jgi:hypothetical protein